ncbi:hypothetical protein N7520_008344 [Penicillium odoratum]|uniref:uncharacterized protein n=1 Tax=Penicillium odoratum TaxID=1167516 RepID=UPI0025471BFD|nr:uncharacterized protein N7520_008344 [Penicillium odoratum]KAJ5761188.1 hypothetical protein N7520_008344 [Penicillium odoratum]
MEQLMSKSPLALDEQEAVPLKWIERIEKFQNADGMRISTSDDDKVVENVWASTRDPPETTLLLIRASGFSDYFIPKLLGFSSVPSDCRLHNGG